MNKPNLRPAPAFQEYASDFLAKREFRMMSLSERGLLMTMRFECWVNKFVPSDRSELAVMFGISDQDVQAYLTPRVLSFFKKVGTDLICIELEAYRENREATHNAQSKGGQKGGKATQEKNRQAKANLEGKLEAKVKPLSRDELNRDEVSREELTNEGSLEEHKEWLDGFENGTSTQSNLYYAQSRGF
jgi:hypothetical protein